MKFLSILVLGNARISGLYSTQYNKVFDAPAKKESKRIFRVKAPVNDMLMPGKNEVQKGKPKRPGINYFAGPHCVFDPHIRY